LCEQSEERFDEEEFVLTSHCNEKVASASYLVSPKSLSGHFFRNRTGIDFQVNWSQF
jgi:hypothetical protein